LIRNCKYNETIEKAENKYEAILISYDGLAHIISRSFKLEKLVRLTENSIITAIFCTSTSSELGVEGLIVDIEGKVHTHSGMLL
jgi:metal-dependent HD superfamily phosphatase/phosphodiesterase